MMVDDHPGVRFGRSDLLAVQRNCSRRALQIRVATTQHAAVGRCVHLPREPAFPFDRHIPHLTRTPYLVPRSTTPMPFPARLETERLLIRRTELSDAHEIFARYAADPAVTKYLTWRPHGSVDDTIAYLKGKVESAEIHHWLLYPREGGPLVGSIGCRVDGHQVQFGYCLACDAWGRGFASETATAMVNTWFQEPTIWRVQAHCDPANCASARVLEKAGLTLEGTLRRYIVAPNVSDVPCDVLVYARVREA
jgi:RimJ/RimL family protein N-acetyltransferase